EAQVVADCGKDGVRGVAGTALEVAAAEVAVGFHVSDHSFDGGAAPQFALDDTEDAALLAGDEDAARIGRIVPAVSLVDIGALDSRPVSLSVASMTASRVWPLGVGREGDGLGLLEELLAGEVLEVRVVDPALRIPLHRTGRRCA